MEGNKKGWRSICSKEKPPGFCIIGFAERERSTLVARRSLEEDAPFVLESSDARRSFVNYWTGKMTQIFVGRTKGATQGQELICRDKKASSLDINLNLN